MDLANAVLGDWDDAVAKFFAATKRRMRDSGVTVAQVRDALYLGCGDEIACAWLEYMGVPPEGVGVASDADDGQANDCRHDSATGIDTTPVSDPGKVWRCDHCGLRWTSGGEGDLL